MNYPLKISGKLGGYTHYALNGAQLRRRLPENLGRDILEKACYAPVRKNMSEFGAASKIGKALRDGMAPYDRKFADGNISGRLLAAVKRMISSGSGRKGRRSFDVRRYGHLLAGFRFKQGMRPSWLVPGVIDVAAEAGRKHLQIRMVHFNPSLVRPTTHGATHVRFHGLACLLSDYFFDEVRGVYRPVSARLNGIAVSACSEPISLASNRRTDLEIELRLPLRLQLPQCVGVVTAFGIELGRLEGEALVSSTKGRCMEVLGVV